MPDSSLLTEILGAYANAASEGFSLIQTYAQSLFGKLLILEFVFIGIAFALDKIDLKSEIVTKIFAIGFVQLLLLRYAWLVDSMRDGFVNAGLAAAGGTLSVPEFLDPSSYISTAFDNMLMILKNNLDNDGIFYILNLDAVILHLIAIFAMFCAYVSMGFLIFLSVVEYYLVSALAIILLPFLAFNKTSFLGMRAINSLVTICIKLMVIAFMAGLSSPVLDKLSFVNNEPTLRESWSLAIGAIAVALVMRRAPSIAMLMISGGGGGLDLSSTITQPTMRAAAGVAAIPAASSAAAGAIGLGSKAADSIANAAVEGIRYASKFIKK